MVQIKRIATIPIIVLVLSITILYAFNISTAVFNPPYLELALQILFVLVTGLAVAVVSAISYLRSGSFNVLLLGSSLLVSGLALTISSLALDPIVPPTISPNQAVTIGNIGLLVASIIMLIGAITTWSGRGANSQANRKIVLATTYFAFVLLVIAITVAAASNLTPPFLTSAGPTAERLTVLALQIVIYFASCLLFSLMYFKSKKPTLYWYSLALGLLVVALIAALFVINIGDVMNWIERLGLYLSGLYFLVALLGLKIRGQEGVGFSESWAEAFRSDREQIATFFSKMIDGFAYCKIITDKGGKPIDYVYLDVNDAFEKISGVKKESILSKRETEVFNEIESDPSWISIDGRVALTGESVIFEKYSLAMKKWLHVSVYCPQKGYFVSILEDITDRKKAEEKLEEYRKNLEKLVEERTKQLKDSERLAAIGATAGMVGHDIRNPLQAITSDVYLAKTDLASIPESEEKNNVQESLVEIEKNVSYINKIVTDLQDFAKHISPKLEETDLEQIIHLVLANLKIPENVAVNHFIGKDFPKLKVDQSYLQRILTNLANNAIQAMPKGGKLTINAVQKGQKAVISVEDTGEGIPENVKSKLFTPLVTTKAMGHGFGLAAVKRFTEGMGGTVTFESEVGKGTKFIIELPVSRL
jgi:PAS domain S-box-containing protein